MHFRKALQRYQDALTNYEPAKSQEKVDYSDYKSVKNHALAQQYETSYDLLAHHAPELFERLGERKELLNHLLLQLQTAHTKKNIQKEKHLLLELANLIADLPEKSPQQSLSYSLPNLPEPVKPEMLADLGELNKCFQATCYRSCVIICGRLLETALHRRYYEATGHDILEKNPGIGLGKLVAKLTEKSIVTDPGLTQQIHLINNVRIFTVHKKKEVFYPSKEQTEATILFTLDVIRKLFSR